MFRNVTGVQEAIVQRQSDDGLSNQANANKLIKDIQSDDIAETYSTLRSKWFRQREQLIQNLKNLEQKDAYPHEIQHVESLIRCFNELIENGEIKQNCQTLFDNMNKNSQLFPETYLLAKKPLGDKMIRLLRHRSKTTTNASYSLETPQQQIDPQMNAKGKQMYVTSDNDQTTTNSSVSTEKMKSAFQFYSFTEKFLDQADKKARKKRYISSSIME